jgi:hypothetical protein
MTTMVMTDKEGYRISYPIDIIRDVQVKTTCFDVMAPVDEAAICITFETNETATYRANRWVMTFE